MTKDLTTVEKKIVPVINQVALLEVKEVDDLIEATDLLTRLNQWKDRVEDDRKELTEPLNRTLKEINSRYKPMKEMLETGISSVRLKMSVYQQKVVEAQREEEEAIARRVGPGRGYLSAEKAVEKFEKIEVAEKRVEGENGSVTFIETEKFEVADMNKLPMEYHLADEKKIREALKEGVRLDGVRYWKEQIVRNVR